MMPTKKKHRESGSSSFQRVRKFRAHREKPPEGPNMDRGAMSSESGLVTVFLKLLRGVGRLSAVAVRRPLLEYGNFVK